MHISDDEFERAIEQVLDDLPERFARVLENVGIVVADEPNEHELVTMSNPCGELLGLYEGIPITKRTTGLQRRDAGTPSPCSRDRMNAYARHRPSCANRSAKPCCTRSAIIPASMMSICTRTATEATLFP